MIVFKPCEEAVARAQFRLRGISYVSEHSFAYCTELGGTSFYCLFTAADTRAEVLDLDLSAGPVIAEGLLRAALNFAAGQSAYTVRCRRESLFDFLLGLGFHRRGAEVWGEIPEILTGSCCNLCK